MIDLNLNPSKKELRTFGLCALGFLCLAGWIVGRRTDSITNGAAIAAIGLVLAVLGFAIPKALRPVWIVLMVVNYPQRNILKNLKIWELFQKQKIFLFFKVKLNQLQ